MDSVNNTADYVSGKHRDRFLFLLQNITRICWFVVIRLLSYKMSFMFFFLSLCRFFKYLVSYFSIRHFFMCYIRFLMFSATVLWTIHYECVFMLTHTHKLCTLIKYIHVYCIHGTYIYTYIYIERKI